MRGQTFPLWIGNILLTLVFSAFIMSYASLVSFQMRAQSAADSVAGAIVAIQAQQFNQMIAGLYASAVEEYRIRHLLESYRVVAMGAGGCGTASGGQDCDAVWNNIRIAYKQSIGRFDKDVRYVNSITSGLSVVKTQGDANRFVGMINSFCAGSGASQFNGHFVCGDRRSPMQFTLISVAKRNIKYSARMDATNMVLPSYFNGLSQTQANADMFTPIKAEVLVCVSVPPFFSWIPGISHAPQQVIARGAAANALVEQDWFQPGYTVNPDTGRLFQPVELYGPQDPVLPINWYAVNFGGRVGNVSWNSGAPQASHIGAAVTDEAFIVKTGWWGPVPIFPFSGGNVPNGACK